MKLKRKPIAEKYADEIEELYSGLNRATRSPSGAGLRAKRRIVAEVKRTPSTRFATGSAFGGFAATTDLPIERLEHEIVQLASHINAGTCRCA